LSQYLNRNVTLVTCGNLFLNNRADEFDFDKLVTDNCYNIDFVDPPISDIAGSSNVIASDATKWFQYLKDNGAKRLKLFYHPAQHIDLPDHISTAFVGGGSYWYIEVQFDTTSALYLCEWIPSESTAYDSRKIHYLRINPEITHLDDTSLSVNEARENLSDILHELIEFTSKFDYTQHWSENFRHYLSVLQKFEPLPTDEFLPSGILSKAATQLIQGASASWVFGGMGSWNDLTFSGTDIYTYDKLTRDLYTAICNAIVAGANSYS
jgi:hypothetical protein